MDILRTKRLIYIALGIVLLGLIIFLLFRLFAPTEPRPTRPEERIVGRVPAPGELPTLPEGKLPEELKPGEELEITPEQTLSRITDFPVVAPSLDPEENKILFYKKDGGNLFSSDFNGQNQEKLSNITIVGMTEAIWSPVRDRAAVFYLDGDILKGFLHIGTSSVAVLPQDIKSFSWSPDGRSLAYLLPQNTRLNLVTADSSAKNPRTVFSTPILDAQINWVTSDKIAFHTAPSGLAEGFAFIFSRGSGVLSRIGGPLFGFTALWSQDGSRILGGTTNAAGKNPIVAVLNAAGQEVFAPGIATFPEKCSWASAKEVYCAVPLFIDPDVILPDDYLLGELNTLDKIVAMDLGKKETRDVFAGGSFDISDLVITKGGEYLFWVDRNDGSLWSLRLK